MPPRRTKEELPQVNGATADVPADKIRVHGLQRGRREDSPLQNTIAKAGREALDLLLQPREHVEG